MSMQHGVVITKDMLPPKKSNSFDIVKFLTGFLYRNSEMSEEVIKTVWTKVYEGKKWSLSVDERDVIVTLCAYMDKASVVKRAIKLGLDSHSEFSEPQEIERVLRKKDAEIERLKKELMGIVHECQPCPPIYSNSDYYMWKAKAEKVAMEETLKAKDAENDELKEEIKESKAEVDRLMGILDDAQYLRRPDVVKDRQDLEADIRSLKTLNDEQTELLNNKRDEVESLGHELKNLHDKILYEGMTQEVVREVLEDSGAPWYPDFVKVRYAINSELAFLKGENFRVKEELEQKEAEIKRLSSELKYIREQIIGKSNKEADYDGFSSS